METRLPELLANQQKRSFIRDVQRASLELQAAGMLPTPEPPPDAADLPVAQPGRLAANSQRRDCNTCHEVHPYLTQDCVPLLFLNVDPLATELARGYPLVSAVPGLTVIEVNMSTGEQRRAVVR